MYPAIKEMMYGNRVVPFHFMYSTTVICFTFLINAFVQGRNIFHNVPESVHCFITKCSTISQEFMFI